MCLINVLQDECKSAGGARSGEGRGAGNKKKWRGIRDKYDYSWADMLEQDRGTIEYPILPYNTKIYYA